MSLLLRAAFLLFHLCLLQRSAWARVELTLSPTVEVFLGQSATILCQHSFKNISKEPLHVFKQIFVEAVGGSKRERIFYSDKNVSIVDNGTDFTDRMDTLCDDDSSSLFIREVRLSDNLMFICQVNGMAAGNAEGKTRLKVFAQPQAPVIKGVLSPISSTTEVPSKVASCFVSNGFPKPNITWYRNREPLTSTPGYVNLLTTLIREDSGLYSVKSTLEYRVTEEDKDAHFSCESSYFVPGAVRKAESSPVNVTVHYPSTMVELWKESPRGLVKEGDAVELRCQGDGNPPPSFSFTREQDPAVYLPNNGDVLELSSVTRRDSGLYQCRPLEAGSQSDIKGEMLLTVHYLDPAVVVPKDSEFMLRGEDLTATCNALSSLKTSTVWYKDDQQIGEGHSLILRDATYETSGEYICEVFVPSLPSLQTRGTVHIIVQGGPEMVGEEQEVQLEEAEGRLVNLSCEAIGHPLPSITWSFTGSQSWQEVASKASDHMIQSVASVKVTSDIVAQCNASNMMGTEVKVFNIRAIPRLPSVDPFSPVEGSGMIIVAIILGLLLLGILGGVLYFLRKKGMISCGRSGKQDITKEKTTKDGIVVEMKSDVKSEEAIHLKAVNGDKAQ